ncbi:MAG TPA: ABC transporter permease, partial [Gemmatimonadales bacterium]|nr:ABC transporter permease [Gemmatimonadales bacterium]
LLGYWGGAALRAMVLPDQGAGYSLADPRTLWFSLLLVVGVGCVTGLAPVLRSRRTDLTTSLKAGTREGGGRRSRARTALLVLQGTLSVVLLVGAGLFVRSLRNVLSIPLGYDVAPVLYINLESRGIVLDDPAAVALRHRMLEAVRESPAVERAALGLNVPFWYSWSASLYVPGIDSVDRLGEFTLQGASPDYFATLGTRILRGRGITERDRKDAPPVVVVSAAMARTLWPGRDPLGQCLRVDADTMPCTTVVGVAEDIKQTSITEDTGLHYYLPIDQYHPASAVLFARVRGDPAAVAEALRRQLQPLMPGDGYVSVTPMRDIVDPELQSWRLGATMFLIFGGLALVLAAIGLYSVIAYDVAQRRHELGVRMALGARGADVVGLVLRDGIRFAVTGVALGGMVALWAGRWLGPLLFAESPRDPLVFGLVALALLAVAALASALPASRAARVDPTVAIRAE